MKFWVSRVLDHKWGPHPVDRLASQLKNKCIRFTSMWWVPGTEAVNAMEENWVGENNWAVPPPRLILNCIKKIENEQADYTLIVSEWLSAPFWPMLFGTGATFKRSISEVFQLPKRNIIDVSPGNNGIFQEVPLLFNILAIKFKFYTACISK